MFSLYIYRYMVEVAHRHDGDGGADPPLDLTTIPSQCELGIISDAFCY